MSKLVFAVGVLCLLSSAASACPRGRRSVVKKMPEQVTYACADKEGVFQGLVTVKDTKGHLLSVGKYKNGKPEGVWTVFDGKGHILSHPLYKDGEVVASDTMKDDEAGGPGVED